jgi:four helix bundle protein
MASDFKDLRVWQQSMRLARHLYDFLEYLPVEERWNLSNQLRRCSISVPSNIAEGQASRTPRNFLRHTRIARGSLAEMETQLLLVQDLELSTSPVPEEIWSELTICRKALLNLEKYLENDRLGNES